MYHPLALAKCFSPPLRSGKAEPPASTARVRARLRNHLRHHELHGGGQATQTRLGSVLFALVQPSKRSVVPQQPRGQYLSLRSLSCPCVSQGRDTCHVVRAVLVFSVSHGDVFMVLSLFMDLLSRRKAEKNKEGRAQMLVLLNTM